MFPEPKNNSRWQPTITLENLRMRAVLLQRIRAFFQKRQVLEVETPCLSQGTVLDPNLHSLSTQINHHKTFYLQTSPEFAMKRLLANGSGCIYQICKAFRDDEYGQRHNPEFTLLEWYRINFCYQELMDEVDQLLQEVAELPNAERKSYRDIFQEYLNIDPLTATIDTLQQCVRHQQIDFSDWTETNKDVWLNLLLSHVIEPKLGHDRPLFIYDFPASQAALSKIRYDDHPVAERFELFINGMEIANGFDELTNPEEQRSRFFVDLQERDRLRLPLPNLDENFLAALEHGLPHCAGVALGIDRLLMVMTQAQSIQEVISFSVENA